jgi:hypothetical protein
MELIGSSSSSAWGPDGGVAKEVPSEDIRVCVVHHNVPGSMGRITSAVAEAGFNINEHVMRTNGALGYQILDVEECEVG